MMTGLVAGQRFGRLTVAGTVPGAFPGRETGVQVLCDCGTVKIVRRGKE